MELRLSNDEMRDLRKEIFKEVKMSQYKELIKAKNSYTIQFNSLNADNFLGLNTSQNKMKYTIPSNNTEGITYCKFRFKNLSIPPSNVALNYQAIHLEVQGGLVMNSGMPIKEIDRTDNQNGGVYPTLVSGIEGYAKAGSSKSLVNRNRAGSFLLKKNRRPTTNTTKYNAVKNDGTIVSLTSNPGGETNIVGGLSSFTNVGCYSEGDNDWRYGLNPFGKILQLDFVSDLELVSNFVDNTNANNGRSGNYTLTIELEIELLPDFLSDNLISVN